MNLKRRELLVLAGGSLILRGQEFEAASIKPSAPSPMGMVRLGIETLPGGRVSITGASVKILIQQAYGVRDFQIINGPSWMATERYDINAKPESASSGDEVKMMMRKLLADRFQLKFHRETKELPTYALVVSKSGAKIKKSDGGGNQVRIGRGQFIAEGVPLTALANRLGDVLGRSVIDKTALTGDYSIELKWTPDEAEGGVFRGPDPNPESRADASGTSLIAALQEQLGLKLESSKGPVELLVVDHVEKASGN